MTRQIEPGSLDAAQFDALVRLMHRPSAATPAARLYAVDGMAKAEAARVAGCTRQALQNTLTAMTQKLGDAVVAAGK